MVKNVFKLPNDDKLLKKHEDDEMFIRLIKIRKAL